MLRPLLADEVELVTLLPEGSSPHGFVCSPRQLAISARADAVISVGYGIDDAFGLSPDLRYGPKGFSMAHALASEAGQHDHHHHGDAAHGDHDHAGHVHVPGAHAWLDPISAAEFVEIVASALPPELCRSADELEGYAAELRALHDELAGVLAPYEGRRVILHHDAWKAMLERWGLDVAAIIRPGDAAESSPADIASAAQLMNRGEADVAIVEPQLPHKSVRDLAARFGIPVVELDPLAGGEYAASLRARITLLAETLQSGANDPAP